MPKEGRVLISTLVPISGGVPAMARFVARALVARGLTPVMAHYEPYQLSPHLSVPAFKLGRGRVGAELRSSPEGYETHAIGAWLPELEFTQYFAANLWRPVIASCDAHVVVSGSALAATPYRRHGRPFVAWIATGWDEDRQDRVARFPWPRRLLDRVVNSPVLRRQERQALRAGSILALSEHTRHVLDAVAGSSVTADVLPMPIDGDFFSPRPEAVVPQRIGFSGRLDDPRKNVELLLAALARANHDRPRLTAVLAGGEPGDRIRALAGRLGVRREVEFLPYLPAAALRDWLQTLDVFVLPSHQEGLCIAALEAMACGCPVVSTRCGGPEEFVIDGQTGFLVDADPDSMASALTRIVLDRALRNRLAEGARRRVQAHNTHAVAESIFWRSFDRTFPGLVP